MGSPEQQSSLPGRQTVRGLLTRTREFVAGAPLPVRILLIALLCICAVPLVPIAMFAALIYAPYALWSGERSAISTASVALWGIAVTAALAGRWLRGAGRSGDELTRRGGSAISPAVTALAIAAIVAAGGGLGGRGCKGRGQRSG